MKKLILALLTAVSMSAFAQPVKIELTPEQKLKTALIAAEATTALVLGPVLLPAAILSGQREGLCKIMGGTYTPNSDGKDQCPGGIWLKTIPYVKDAVTNE